MLRIEEKRTKLFLTPTLIPPQPTPTAPPPPGGTKIFMCVGVDIFSPRPGPPGPL